MAKNPETMNELMEKVLEILPDAHVEELHGQLIVWTGLREGTDGKLELDTPE